MNEPSELRTLAAELEVILDRVNKLRAEVDAHFAKAKSEGFPATLLIAVGYTLHNFYTGLEEMFLRIAHSFDCL